MNPRNYSWLLCMTIVVGSCCKSRVASAFSILPTRVKMTGRRTVSVQATNNGVESVAVIGGGIAGLTCASVLSKSGRYDPTVFDTGRLRPGGRCSSRLPDDEEKHDTTASYTYLKSTIVDHAAQILIVPKGFSQFQILVPASRSASGL